MRGALLLGAGAPDCAAARRRSRAAEASPTGLLVLRPAENVTPRPAPEAAVTRSFQSVPLVDIAGLFSDDVAARHAVAEAMGRASRDVGFFYVVGHGLDAALYARLRGAAEAFFTLPMERKMAAYIGGSENHSGYVPEGEEMFAS